MRLARVRYGDAVRPGITDADGLRLLEACGDDPWLDWLRSGRPALPHGTRVEEQQVTLLAPLRRPGKIVAIGLNYADHAAESGLPAPLEPLTFAKYPSSIIGPDAPIVVPTAVTTSVDWEVELAAVVGTACGPGRRGTMSDIAAYTVANDVSARDLQVRDLQWTRAKSIDTFCPLGPHLVTPEEIADPQRLPIWAKVNDTVMQDASTADLIFGLAQLMDFLTASVSLEPGDVVLTGTPPGVGGFRTPPVYLQDGDTVEVGIEGLGSLHNTVRWD